MTPERRVELLEELDALRATIDRWLLDEEDEGLDIDAVLWRRADVIDELDEADDPEPDSGTTLGLEPR